MTAIFAAAALHACTEKGRETMIHIETNEEKDVYIKTRGDVLALSDEVAAVLRHISENYAEKEKIPVRIVFDIIMGYINLNNQLGLVPRCKPMDGNKEDPAREA